MIKLLDINQNDWDKVADIARHLGRSNELISCDIDGLAGAVCSRKKPTDRQYKILNSSIGLIVVMDADDMNYTQSVIAGNTYVCKIEGGGKEYSCWYVVDVLEVTNEIIKINYHAFKDEKLTEELWGKLYNMEWRKDEVKIVSFRKYNP